MVFKYCLLIGTKFFFSRFALRPKVWIEYSVLGQNPNPWVYVPSGIEHSGREKTFKFNRAAYFYAAAAKSLQSCPTLNDPMDCSLPGSSVRAIFQARVLEWGAIAFSLLLCMTPLSILHPSLAHHSQAWLRPEFFWNYIQHFSSN